MYLILCGVPCEILYLSHTSMKHIAKRRAHQLKWREDKWSSDMVIIIVVAMCSSSEAFAKKFCSAEIIIELELHVN